MAKRTDDVLTEQERWNMQHQQRLQQVDMRITERANNRDRADLGLDATTLEIRPSDPTKAVDTNAGDAAIERAPMDPNRPQQATQADMGMVGGRPERQSYMQRDLATGNTVGR